MTGFMTASEAAEKWNISHRRVITLCNEQRIKGVGMLGNMWIIPVDATKPADGRCKRKPINKERHFTVTIEETVSEDFDVVSDNVENALKIAIKKYKQGDLTLVPGNLTDKQIMVYDEQNDVYTDWVNF